MARRAGNLFASSAVINANFGLDQDIPKPILLLEAISTISQLRPYSRIALFSLNYRKTKQLCAPYDHIVPFTASYIDVLWIHLFDRYLMRNYQRFVTVQLDDKYIMTPLSHQAVSTVASK